MLESSTHSHSNQTTAVPNHIRSSAGTAGEGTGSHPGDGFHSIPQEYFLSHKDLYLRKGKWTAEEERYANKVIEYFNGGILKLDDHERGITLRAYLAQKLGCDPMRITKKYTGASCLGKRVYHAYKQGGKNEEVDKATADLNVLEDEFRSRLQQMNKRRGGGTYSDGQQVMVSSPAIDSMFKQSGYATGWNSQPGMMYGYPMSGYMSNESAGHSAVEMHIKQQHLLQQNQLQHGYHNGGHSSASIVVLYLTAEASPYTSPLEHLSRTARSYSSDQTTAADYSPCLTGLRPSADPSNDQDWNHSHITAKTEGSSGGRVFSEHLARSGNGAHRKGSDSSTSSGGSSTTHRRKKILNVEKTLHAPELYPPDPARDEHAPHDRTSSALQRVKVSEHDTEAASSLLGFFTQLERNSSQEDMLHFFEGVQKTAAAATQSPPKGSHAASSGSMSGGMSSAHYLNFPLLPPASMSNK